MVQYSQPRTQEWMKVMLLPNQFNQVQDQAIQSQNIIVSVSETCDDMKDIEFRPQACGEMNCRKFD
jgi:gluconate kinase